MPTRNRRHVQEILERSRQKTVAARPRMALDGIVPRSMASQLGDQGRVAPPMDPLAFRGMPSIEDAQRYSDEDFAEAEAGYAQIDRDARDRMNPMGAITSPFVNMALDPDRRASVGAAASGAGDWLADVGQGVGDYFSRGDAARDAGNAFQAAPDAIANLPGTVSREAPRAASGALNAIGQGIDWVSNQANPDVFEQPDFIGGVGSLAMEYGDDVLRGVTYGPWENERAQQHELDLARARADRGLEGGQESVRPAADAANLETLYAGLNAGFAPLDVPALANWGREVLGGVGAGVSTVSRATRIPEGAPRTPYEGMAPVEGAPIEGEFQVRRPTAASQDEFAEQGLLHEPADPTSPDTDIYHFRYQDQRGEPSHIAVGVRREGPEPDAWADIRFEDMTSANRASPLDADEVFQRQGGRFSAEQVDGIVDRTLAAVRAHARENGSRGFSVTGADPILQRKWQQVASRMRRGELDPIEGYSVPEVRDGQIIMERLDDAPMPGASPVRRLETGADPLREVSNMPLLGIAAPAAVGGVAAADYLDNGEIDFGGELAAAALFGGGLRGLRGGKRPRGPARTPIDDLNPVGERAATEARTGEDLLAALPTDPEQWREAVGLSPWFSTRTPRGTTATANPSRVQAVIMASARAPDGRFLFTTSDILEKTGIVSESSLAATLTHARQAGIPVPARSTGGRGGGAGAAVGGTKLNTILDTFDRMGDAASYGALAERVGGSRSTIYQLIFQAAHPERFGRTMPEAVRNRARAAFKALGRGGSDPLTGLAIGLGGTAAAADYLDDGELDYGEELASAALLGVGARNLSRVGERVSGSTSVASGMPPGGGRTRSPAVQRLAELPSGSDFMLTGDMHWLGKTGAFERTGIGSGTDFRIARVFDDVSQAEAFAGARADEVMGVTTSPDGRTMVVLKRVEDFEDEGMATMTDVDGNTITGSPESVGEVFDRGGINRALEPAPEAPAKPARTPRTPRRSRNDPLNSVGLATGVGGTALAGSVLLDEAGAEEVGQSLEDGRAIQALPEGLDLRAGEFMEPWRQKTLADGSEALARTITLDGQVYELIGVQGPDASIEVLGYVAPEVSRGGHTPIGGGGEGNPPTDWSADPSEPQIRPYVEEGAGFDPLQRAGASAVGALLLRGLVPRGAPIMRSIAAGTGALAADAATGGDPIEALGLAAGGVVGSRLVSDLSPVVSGAISRNDFRVARERALEEAAVGPEFEARRDAFAATLPAEAPRTRNIEANQANALDGRFLIPRDEVVEQGFATERVGTQASPREQFLGVSPAEQLEWMDNPSYGAPLRGVDSGNIGVTRGPPRPPPRPTTPDPVAGGNPFFDAAGKPVFGSPARTRAQAPRPPLAERAAEKGAAGAMQGVSARTMRQIAGDLDIETQGVKVGDLRRSIVRNLAQQFDSTRELVSFLARYGVPATALGFLAHDQLDPLAGVSP